MDSLTSLRFAAAILVFGTHAVGQIPSSGLRDALDPFFVQGNIGVSFFFILSGFVMVWSQRPGDEVRGFYRRRFARIAPAYWLALVLGVALQLVIRDHSPVQTIVESTPSVVGLQAWFPTPTIYYAGNAVGWSLSVEMFFYAIFPLIALLLRHQSAGFVLGVVSVGAVIAVPVILRPETAGTVPYWAVYIFPLQRLAEFVIGALLARWMKNGSRFPVPLVPAVLLAIAAYMLAGQVPLWAGVVLVTLVPLVILIGAAAQSDLDGRQTLLTRPGFVQLGEWSYAFYLLHALVITTLVGLAKRLDGGYWLILLALGLALPTSLAAAGVVYKYIERPLERRLRGATPLPPSTALRNSERI